MTQITGGGATARGGCPACGTTIPFFKGSFRRTRPFACRGCGAQLTTARGPASGGIALFCLASAAARVAPTTAIMALLVAGVVIEWLTAKVYLAGAVEAGEAPPP